MPRRPNANSPALTNQLTCTKENVLCRRMPLDKSYSPLVSNQIDDRLFQIPMKTAVRDLPYLDGAIFGCAGDDVIVVRTPLKVKDCGLVTRHKGCISVDPTDLCRSTPVIIIAIINILAVEKYDRGEWQNKSSIMIFEMRFKCRLTLTLTYAP